MDFEYNEKCSSLENIMFIDNVIATINKRGELKIIYAKL